MSAAIVAAPRKRDLIMNAPKSRRARGPLRQAYGISAGDATSRLAKGSDFIDATPKATRRRPQPIREASLTMFLRADRN
jgi:hypothetical protein